MFMGFKISRSPVYGYISGFQCLKILRVIKAMVVERMLVLVVLVVIYQKLQYS